jgi:2'-5' RNA ligase
MEMGDPQLKQLYFIALVAPAEIDRMALSWKKDLQQRYGCKVALKSPAHITLIPPYTMHPEAEPEVLHFLQSFAVSRPALPFSVNGFDHFGHRTIFLAVEKNPDLQHLYTQLKHDFCNQFPGFHLQLHKDFHPHITIANRDIPHAAFTEIVQQFQQLGYHAAGLFNAITLLRLEKGKWVAAGTADFLTQC